MLSWFPLLSALLLIPFENVGARRLSDPPPSTTKAMNPDTTPHVATIADTAAAIASILSKLESRRSHLAPPVIDSKQRILRRRLGSAESCQVPEKRSTFSYVPEDSSARGFLGDSFLHTLARTAASPPGFHQTHRNYLSTTEDVSYQSSIEIASYDPEVCATHCTQISCSGFEIHFERAPLYEPSHSCQDPQMQTRIRCAFFGRPLNVSYTTNIGRWRKQFQVVLSGVNGYTWQSHAASLNTQHYEEDTTALRRSSGKITHFDQGYGCSSFAKNTPFRDLAGMDWTLFCGSDAATLALTSEIGLGPIEADSFSDCFDHCYAEAECTAWRYGDGSTCQLYRVGKLMEGLDPAFVPTDGTTGVAMMNRSRADIPRYRKRI